MTTWNKMKISDIAEVIGGGTPSTGNSTYWGEEIPWLTPKDLSGYKKRYISKGSRSLSKVGLKNCSAKILPKGSILLTSRAPIGYLAIAEDNLCTNQGFKSLVLKEEYDSKFIYYLLKKNIDYIINMSSGSTFAEISGGQVKNLEFDIPDLETQQKIAKVLSAIDDKIELNNSINNNLEQQAQAIFKSWFVDFEPFGGTMPDDWKVVDLGDICNISAGGDKPSKFSVIQTQEFQIPIYSNGINNEGLYGYTNYAKINNESVTISARGTIGYTCLRLNPFFPIVRLICIEPKNRLFSAKYLYQAIKRMDIVGFGTTQQQITVPYCKTLKILLPSKEYLYKYANIVDRLYKEIFENKNENIKLIQLRDTLLPKLMSGEIDVSKVDISADKLLFREDK